MFKDFNGVDVDVGDNVLFVPAIEGGALRKARVVGKLERIPNVYYGPKDPVTLLHLQYKLTGKRWNRKTTSFEPGTITVGVFLNPGRVATHVVKVVP